MLVIKYRKSYNILYQPSFFVFGLNILRGPSESPFCFDIRLVSSKVDGNSMPFVSGNRKHRAPPPIAITPNNIAAVNSDRELIGGADICPILETIDNAPRTEFLILVGNISTPYKKLTIKAIKKKALQMQANMTLYHTWASGINTTQIMKLPEQSNAIINKGLLPISFNKNMHAIVPGTNERPDIKTFKCISPLISPINCDTP